MSAAVQEQKAVQDQRKTDQQVKKEARRKKVQEIIHTFKHHLQPVKVDYTCERCGESRVTFVLRQRSYAVGRTCLDNIDADYGDKCQFTENILKRDYHIKYTNFDMCYEYTSDYELKHIPWLPTWWNKKKINFKTDHLRLHQVKTDLSQLKQLIHKMAELKSALFQDRCGITNVNTKLLECLEQRLDYYECIINYNGKFNKYPMYTDFECPEWGYCHGCACKVYLKTQYERAYVCTTARDKMHQVEFMDESKQNEFVCQWCIGKAMSRAGDLHSDFIGKSLLYNKQWNEVNYISQIWFALGHLDNSRLPVHVSWYDIKHGSFRRGKIMEIGNEKHLLMKIHVYNAENARDRIQWIPLKAFGRNSFFIYQKPSTSWSFEYVGKGCPAKFWKEEKTIVDTTSPDFEKAFLKKNIFLEDRGLIKFDWYLPLVHKGLSKMSSFLHVHHMKCVYEQLKSHGYLEDDSEEEELNENSV